MNSEQSDQTSLRNQSANAEQNQDGPENVVSTNADVSRAAESSRTYHDEPPCHCWHNGIPKEKRVAQTPVALNLVLPPVRAELSRAIKALNSIIKLVARTAEFEETAPSLPPDVRETFSSNRETVSNGFETAGVIITTTPGYVCKQGSTEHQRRYTERHKALTNIEDELTRSIKEAEPLFKGLNELKLAERRYRRRKYFQAAVRTMSIIAIPYSPLLSALITVADVFGVSVVIAIQRVVFPDTDDQLEETLERVTTLERDIQHKVEEVKRLREHLEAVRAKLEEEQQHPIAAQLAGILDKVYLAKHVAERALAPPCAKCACAHTAVSIREVVASLQDMAAALGGPTVVVGPLASLSENQCVVLDRALALLRTSPSPSDPDSAQAGSN